MVRNTDEGYKQDYRLLHQMTLSNATIYKIRLENKYLNYNSRTIGIQSDMVWRNTPITVSAWDARELIPVSGVNGFSGWLSTKKGFVI